MNQHPIHRLDDDVHQRVRLGILATLDGVKRADFAHLKQTLEVTDGNLGRHLEVLQEAGLIASEKADDDGRARSWFKITRKGRAALRAELKALQELIASIEPDHAARAARPEPT